MKTIQAIRAPLIVLSVIWACGAASLAWSAHELPTRVASHFDARWQPNGWMERTAYLQAMGTVGLAVPLVPIGIGLLIGLLPSGAINLPQREYWLSPERRGEATRYIARHMAWLACLVTVLFLALNWLMVEANRESPPSFSNAVGLTLIVFVGLVTLWTGLLLKHFLQTEP